MSDLDFWIITTAFAVLVGLVAYFYRRSISAEASVIAATADHIKETVDDLTNAIREHSKRSEDLFELNNKRITVLEAKMVKMETRCTLYHGEG